MRALAALAEPDTPFTHDGAPPTANPDTPLSSALDPLFRRHAPWLTAFLRLRHGRETAEDLVQETFLRAARAGTAASVRHPRAWLLTIARNAARDRARRQAARPKISDADPAPILEAAPAAPCQDEALLLKQVILGLPPRLREVFVLHRFGGLTYEEIARRLGLSIKTVEGRMTKALVLCAARLRD
jgi:RNA polymerase sigma factor (sigma-70 family)